MMRLLVCERCPRPKRLRCNVPAGTGVEMYFHGVLLVPAEQYRLEDFGLHVLSGSG